MICIIFNSTVIILFKKMYGIIQKKRNIKINNYKLSIFTIKLQYFFFF